MMKGNRWLAPAITFAAGVGVTLLCHNILFQSAAPATASSFASAGAAHSEKPWGTIEALEIPLAEKKRFAPDLSIRLQPPQWFFEGWDEDRLARFFQGCPLTEKQKMDLCRNTPWLVASNGLLGSPTPNLVAGLNTAAREQIYAALARSGLNYPQQYPFRFSPATLQSRLASTRLAEPKLKELWNLSYADGEFRCFADLELLPDLLTSEEFEDVLDCLYCLPAYRLRLRVFPNSDVEALTRYWGAGGREKKIMPLLSSLTKVRRTGGVSIGIDRLLPAFACLRLDTYPTAWPEPQTSREDCFWTSLNFFNDQPDMRYLESAFVRKTLQSDYQPVSGTPALGDLIALLNESGDALHVCVYIADDFVFTKNGMNPLSPWVIMKLQDMLPFFHSGKNSHLAVLRHKRV